ncbi:transposase [Nonomuraea sp. NPDC046570]|uniref:RNA-guided endonuclease InsQ/TnpB family protein n=1 Tax=Nonomuraea sp. NPDC046570 TaxID=3155255 RepID=UPI003410D693
MEGPLENEDQEFARVPVPEGGKIAVERLNRRWGRAKLPKLGWVRFRWTKPLGGTVKNATVTRNGRHWYISFLIEDEITTPERHAHPGSGVGIDRGVAKVVTRSDGVLHHRTFVGLGELAHDAKLRRELARTKKGSKRRKRALARLAGLSRRVRHRREDFAAQTAHILATRFELIALEALKTKNMTTAVAPKPDPDNEGGFLPNGAAAKSGMNRALLDKGWYRIERAIRSKARSTGTHVITVNPAYTSQTCNPCGHTARENRESQAVFRCVACGHRAHADVNAAKNILAAGRAEHMTARPAARVGARKPRAAVGRKANRQATAAPIPSKGGELAGIPRP